MTGPVRPLVLSLDGRSARELYAIEQTNDNGEPTNPPFGRGGVLISDLTIADGGSVKVMTAQPSGETGYWPRSPWYDSTGANQMRVVVDDVEVAGHTTARIYAKQTDTVGGTFAHPGIGVTEVAAPINATGPSKSAWIDLDPTAIGERLWKAFAIGGNTTLTPAAGGVHFQFRQVAVLPPLIVGPPGTLYAKWLLTEGSGDTVANKLAGGVTADLILGNSAGSDIGDPTWNSVPRRLTMGGGIGGGKDKMHYPSVPSLAVGSALFFYYELDALGTGGKIVCSMEGGAVPDHQLIIDTGTRQLSASVTEDSGGGGGTPRVAISTTTLPDGFKGLIGLRHDGATLGVYINPSAGAPEATTACAIAKEPGGRTLVLGANAINASSTVDNSSIGDIWFWVGIPPTVDEIVDMYNDFKAIYSALP